MTRRGELDKIEICRAPLDVLAQQIVAEVANREWSADELYELCVKAYGFRALKREKFDQVIQMLAESA